MSLSFGYSVTAGHKDGDISVLTGLDLFEISIVPAPANDRTRVVSMKGADLATTFAEILQRPEKGSAREQSRKKAARAALPIQIASFEF